ncbi:hypothetical protein ES708_23597 [subsurface metagenome]
MGGDAGRYAGRRLAWTLAGLVAGGHKADSALGPLGPGIVSERQRWALVCAMSRGQVRSRDLAAAFPICQETARTDLVHLVATGRLVRHSARRGRYYTWPGPGIVNRPSRRRDERSTEMDHGSCWACGRGVL